MSQIPTEGPNPVPSPDEAKTALQAVLRDGARADLLDVLHVEWAIVGGTLELTANQKAKLAPMWMTMMRSAFAVQHLGAKLHKLPSIGKVEVPPRCYS